MSRRVALTGLLAFCVGALGIGMPSCGRPCRTLTTQPLDVQCEVGSVYEGELHLDDPAVFESFLSLECIPSAPAEEIAALVASVDFTRDAVFVAVGRRQVQTRCIESREAANVAACDDGLRVAFEDDLSASFDCVGRWTVAFTLAREDLRAALGETPAAEL